MSVSVNSSVTCVVPFQIRRFQSGSAQKPHGEQGRRNVAGEGGVLDAQVVGANEDGEDTGHHIAGGDKQAGGGALIGRVALFCGVLQRRHQVGREKETARKYKNYHSFQWRRFDILPESAVREEEGVCGLDVDADAEGDVEDEYKEVGATRNRLVLPRFVQKHSRQHGSQVASENARGGDGQVQILHFALLHLKQYSQPGKVKKKR